MFHALCEERCVQHTVVCHAQSKYLVKKVPIDQWKTKTGVYFYTAAVTVPLDIGCGIFKLVVPKKKLTARVITDTICMHSQRYCDSNIGLCGLSMIVSS